MHPFGYDPFQEQAIAAILKHQSVFVTAPTGAGKTVIAEVAVEEALASGGMCIYTAPIKALSNQKFRDFHALYGDRVGILTGDLTLNPEAPLLIMTTEIYRNTLFENAPRFRRCRWVIFDEVHYLDDPQRGTVWEEALLLTPRETEILALSATIPNAQELAGWIERIHERPVHVIEETHRPVPLKFYFQCHDQLFSSLGELKRAAYFSRSHEKHRANRPDHLLRIIQSKEQLPCLYFTFSRRRVEELAWEFAGLGLLPAEKKGPLLNRFDQLVRRYQITHEPSAQEMRQLVAQGIAFHHAGLLPSLKEVVEILFTSRMIQAIVTTETFALGINMPARSVVLDTVTRRMRGPYTLLKVRELSQMAGRAGRRGMDEEGFVYLRVNPWEVPYDSLEHLLHGKPERVVSRFNLSYATILNLYRHYRAKLLPFYQQTFHAFQSGKIYQKEAMDSIDRKLTLLKEWNYVHAEGLTPKGTFASEMYGYELIFSELFESGYLDRLSVTDLGVLLLAMVYEPRLGIFHRPKLPRRIRALGGPVSDLLEEIHRRERRLRISPLTKIPAFQFSPAMELWLGGARFDRVVQEARADEGEVIRYFRMTLQLARTLSRLSAASESLRKKAWELFGKINRDPVDAEAELRRSL